ncbi:MFS transporter [Streptomyces sp. NPDC051976]|uniref:MFS transporter n=1 Tax=Streptomyces sp. NPDC051976 TaxID=3154947 RepID=UPI0034442A71
MLADNGPHFWVTFDFDRVRWQGLRFVTDPNAQSTVTAEPAELSAPSSQRLWRNRDFVLLMGADTVSQIGTQVTLIALPVTALVTLDASPFQIGMLTAVEMMAFLVLGLPVGVWVDRMRRRPIQVVSDLVRAVALLSVPVAWGLDALTLWQLFAVAAVVGVGTVFFDVAHMSYLPTVVKGEHLTGGAGALESVYQVSKLGGPGLGGLLVQLLRAPAALVVDGVSYLLSALLLGRIGAVEEPPERTGHERLRVQVAEGLRCVAGNRIIRLTAANGALTMLFFGAWSAISVVFVIRELGVSPGVYGLLLIGVSVGGTLGAVAAARIVGRIGTGRTMWWASLLSIPAIAVIPFTGAGWALGFFVLGAGVFELFSSVFNVAQFSYRMAVLPQHLHGRVNATMRFLMWGATPIGALSGGALLEGIGARHTLWVCAAGFVLPQLLVLVTPGLRALPEPAATA